MSKNHGDYTAAILPCPAELSIYDNSKGPFKGGNKGRSPCQLASFSATIQLMDASVALADLGETVNLARMAATKQLDPEKRSEFGQVLTPHFVAKLMADRLSLHRSSIRLLDPGAGIGSLIAAVVQRILQSDERPTSVHVDVFEIDSTLAGHLDDTLKLCATHLARIQNVEPGNKISERDAPCRIDSFRPRKKLRKADLLVAASYGVHQHEFKLLF
jgi:hypothetical protein